MGQSVLSGGDFVDWNLLLNDGTNTVDLLGPLSGENSGIFGSSVTEFLATSTQLQLNFSNSDFFYFILGYGPGSGYAGPLKGSQICFADAGCDGASGGGVTISIVSDPIQYTSLSGDAVIGTSAPEASTLSLLCAGGILLARRKTPHSKD